MYKSEEEMYQVIVFTEQLVMNVYGNATYKIPRSTFVYSFNRISGQN